MRRGSPNKTPAVALIYFLKKKKCYYVVELVIVVLSASDHVARSRIDSTTHSK